MIWDGKQVIYLVDTKSYEVGRKQGKIGLSKVKKCPALGGKLCNTIKFCQDEQKNELTNNSSLSFGMTSAGIW